MKRLQKSAILISLIENLQKYESWCGETHIQKSTYFLQELLKVPLEFHFILYKHGPFSFDLRGELAAMLADDFYILEPQYNYGPKHIPSTGSNFLKENFTVTIEKYSNEIVFVAQKLGNMRVDELERVATALYIKRKFKDNDADLAKEIVKIKPHISMRLAKEAVQKSERIISDCRSEFGITS
ncbi:MAG: hypothetical protein HQ591_05150 [candidate division Zixibacteria bacterium]|nr:hypothetical protein [Candidatus Tariuqbacter arcticus]